MNDATTRSLIQTALDAHPERSLGNYSGSQRLWRTAAAQRCLKLWDRCDCGRCDKNGSARCARLQEVTPSSFHRRASCRHLPRSVRHRLFLNTSQPSWTSRGIQRDGGAKCLTRPPQRFAIPALAGASYGILGSRSASIAIDVASTIARTYDSPQPFASWTKISRNDCLPSKQQHPSMSVPAMQLHDS